MSTTPGSSEEVFDTQANMGEVPDIPTSAFTDVPTTLAATAEDYGKDPLSISHEVEDDKESKHWFSLGQIVSVEPLRRGWYAITHSGESDAPMLDAPAEGESQVNESSRDAEEPQGAKNKPGFIEKAKDHPVKTAVITGSTLLGLYTGYKVLGSSRHTSEKPKE